MRKKYIYFFCLLLSISTTQLNAQNCWSPLGSIIDDNNTNIIVNALITYNGNLFASGGFDSIGGIAANNIAMWNGSSWSALGSGLSANSNSIGGTDVATMAVYNGELYVAGQFDTAGGIPANNIAKWNGSSWSTVSSGIPGNVLPVSALAVYNGNLYAGGDFDTAGGVVAHSIAKWNGTQWSAVDTGMLDIGSNGTVLCLQPYNGKLYAGGSFIKAGSVSAANIAVWNDTAWSAIGSGVGIHPYGGVTSINFYKGDLYAGFYGDAGIPPAYYPGPDSIATWDGTVWSVIANVVTFSFGSTTTLFPFDSNLIVGGEFDSIGGIAASGLAQWNGTNWSEFGGGISTSGFPGVNAFTIYNGYLYIGGSFIQVGSDSANSTAKYNNCGTAGIHEVSADHVHVHPNPTTGMINITTDNAGAGSSVQVYDLLGQKVFQSNINSNNTIINLSGHAPGTYIYHISGVNGENISAGTFIIQ